MESSAREETQRILRKLRTALRLLGFTNREIERRLGYTPSYLSRLFSGQIELRFEHVVDITEAMGLTVAEFFAFAYPDRHELPSDSGRLLTEILEDIKPSPPEREPEPLVTPEMFEKILAALEREPEEPARTKRRKA